MAYGTANVDNIQSSTVGTPVVFKDGGGTQIGTLCRAWVNFNGTGTVAIRASFNVSSITDNGTGDYTVNFTNAMPDVNYSANVNSSLGSGGFSLLVNVFNSSASVVAPTTSAFRFTALKRSDGAALDAEYLTASVFR